MRRAPGTSRSVGFSLAGVFVFLLAVAVIGGTVYGWTRWQADIEEATDSATVEPDRTTTEDLPEAPDSPDDVTEEPAEPAYEDPTFDVLKPTANRPRPEVLVIGDGYAAGRGASAPDLAFPALLSTELGWDVNVEAAVGAGYVSTPPTLLELVEAAPADPAPDLVVVQGAYGGRANATNDEAKAAVEELAAAIATQWPDAPLVVLTPLAPAGATPQVETRERTLARAWREDPDTLVLRPLEDGWSDAAQDDAGHRLISDELVAALRDAGLAKKA